MGATSTSVVSDSRSRIRMWLGIVLLAAGLSGHLLAAQAIGGYYVAYRDHIFGFVLATVVTGAIIAGLGWRFWRGRHDITVLVLGVVQAIFGVWIYINRFNIR
jgi:uncharacterized membrane protein (UPF0136 family)